MHTYIRGQAILVAAAAVFLLTAAAPAAAVVTVKLAGSGSGKVIGGPSNAPEQIKCSDIPGEEFSECSHVYLFTKITLNATPGPYTVFGGWSGACAGSTSPSCEFSAFTQTVTATFTTTAQPPEVAISPVAAGPVSPCSTAVTAGGACFAGTVNPKGIEVSECRFEYVPLSQYEASGFTNVTAQERASCEKPSAAEVGSGQSPVDVHGAATGLEPHTAYRVRLFAANPALSAVSGVQSFTTLPVPPTVETEKAWSVSDTTASLVATVDPRNSQVSECRFEYGPSTAYGHTAPCAANPGSGGSPAQVTANVEGLSSQSAYHFRIVAGDECATGCGVAEGEDASFETLPAVVFPRRGYELVSAADTNGIEALPNFSSLKGEAYSYFSYIPAPGAPNGETYAPVVATRNAGGSWSQVGVGAPPGPGEQVRQGVPVFSSADLSFAVFASRESLDPADQNGEIDIYRQKLDSGALTWLSRNPELAPGVVQTEPGEAGAVDYVSPDGGLVLFESFRHLLPSDTSITGYASLYEWSRQSSGASKLSLVGIPPGQAFGSARGSRLGSGSEFRESTYGAVSAEGSRIAFESQDESGNYHLYVRLHGERTVEASKSVGVSPEVTSPFDVTYWGAGAQDERVFFTSSSALTADSHAPNAGTTGGVGDLYVYEPGSEALHDLTPQAGGGDVTRVYAVSDDGRRVYFSSEKQLTAGQGIAGGPNLYVAELNEAGELAKSLTFIATINPEEDLPGGGMYKYQREREAAANPSGSLLAFRDSLNLVPGRQTGGLPQVFVYDATREQLSCASCPPDGSAATAAANLSPSFFNPSSHRLASIDGNGSTSPVLPHSRNVSDDGVVYFQTATALVPGDSDGAIDIYEYRDGRVNLISTGAEAQDSAFGDASVDGSTVFFESSASLVPGAQAGIYHIYAAKEGVANFTTPTPAPSCTGTDCRASLIAPPGPQSIGSAALLSAGNIVAASSPSTGKARAVARNRKLARALKACKRRRGRRRTQCERRARSRYGMKSRAATSHTRNKGHGAKRKDIAGGRNR
jgi:WD40-like Beta Propeller Repeat